MTDWFGGIGKDLSGFVGEVTKTVQSQVSQLQQANESEQKSSHEPYGAFAPNESVLDSFFTSFSAEETAINNNTPQPDTDHNTTDNTQQQTATHHLSSPSPRGASATPSALSATPNTEAHKPNPSDVDVSEDENKANTDHDHKNKDNIQQIEQREALTNVESLPVAIEVIDTETNVQNDTDIDMKYQQLLSEKKQGDAKYKVLKAKFGKLHSKYKQIKEQNEKEHTLSGALKHNLNELSTAHNKEMEQLNKERETERNDLNGSIDNKQSKIKQLVKELNEQSLTIERNDICIKKYETEGNILRNKLETLNTELTDNKCIINELNQGFDVFKQENEALKIRINDLKQKRVETDRNDKEKHEEQVQIEPGDNDECVEQKEGVDENITPRQELVSPSPSYVKVGSNLSESLLFISTQEMEHMKMKYNEEIANWKLMYEEIEKTAFEAVQNRNNDKIAIQEEMDELKEESARLQHNLTLREEQLEKTSIKLSKMNENEHDVGVLNEELDKYKRRIHSLSEENEILSQQQSTSSVSNTKWKKMIAQKDAEIEDIMREGEEWASNCHSLESKIKKILEQMTDKSDEISDLNSKLENKDERITNLLESINTNKSDSVHMDERNKLLLKHNEDTKLENVQLMEEMIAVKTKMKHIENERDEYVEMIEENKDIVSKLNIEMASEREHIDRYKSGKKNEAHLFSELTELRSEMKRVQSVERKKYDRLLREKESEKELRISAEKRNEELSLEISKCTQPLLRQMESLKNSHFQRKSIWENLEKDLRKKMGTLETGLNSKEKKVNAILSDLENYKMISNKMEIGNKRLKEENENYKERLNVLKDRFDEIEMKYDDVLSDADMFRRKAVDLGNVNKNVRRDYEKFRRDYENEHNRLQNVLTTEEKKREELQKTITILQQKLRQFETENDNGNNNRGTDVLLIGSVGNGSGNNNMWTVSRIQNELRQKENELKSLKQRLINIQSTNDTFSDEIVKLKSQNETLTKYHTLYKNQSKQINALKLRYEAAIDIVIEKEKHIQQLTNS